MLLVIGTGFDRTGTMSIKIALEQLWLGLFHNMEKVFTSSVRFHYGQAMVDRRSIEWGEVFNGYNSIIDWPNTHHGEELADVFSDAKILLDKLSGVHE